MPATTKRVSFASVNTTYSPRPSTPSSPALSTSSSLPSLSDSEEPATPPAPMPQAHLYPGTPYPYNRKLQPTPLPIAPSPRPLTPVPAMPVEEMSIHLFLAFNPLKGAQPPLEYAVTLPPTYLLKSQLTLPEFHEAATEPPLSALYITHPNLTAPISVFAGPTGVVTISDVFHAMYHAFLQPTTTEEYESLPRHLVGGVNRAYYSRCEATVDVEAQLKWGIKRIDLLGGRHRFLGLSGTSHGYDIWKLNVD